MNIIKKTSLWFENMAATNTTSGYDDDNDETVPFVWLDYAVFSLMLVISIATGLYHALAGKGQKTTSK